MIRIVPHGKSDYWATVELRRRVLRWPLGLDFTDEELAAEHNQVHIADMEGDIARACLIMVRQVDAAKMRQVAVDQAFQGQGLGRSLVEFAESWARGEGFQSINLHARETAIPFYMALGYTVDGEEFIDVGIQHRLMEKSLAAS